MFYSASAVTSADPNPIDWSAQLASSEPPGVSTATWTAVVNDIASQMGSTEGSYAAALPVVFAEAAGYGVTFTSEAQILNYLVRRALATAPGAAVSGTLYLGNTSTPLSQASISLADGTGEPQYATTSWYNGQFDVWDVTPGTYELTAQGYTPHPAQQVVASPTANGLSVVVQTGATLSGKITNAATSDPVSGATVTATDSDGTLDSDVTGGERDLPDRRPRVGQRDRVGIRPRTGPPALRHRRGRRTGNHHGQHRPPARRHRLRDDHHPRGWIATRGNRSRSAPDGRHPPGWHHRQPGWRHRQQW